MGPFQGVYASAAVVLRPDMTVSKSNNVNGSVALGQSFTWTIRVENIGTAAGVYDKNNKIVEDNMPFTGMNIYGTPVVTSSGVTGMSNVNCSQTGATAHQDLTCSVVNVLGASTSFAPNAYLQVSVQATANAIGTYVNPRPGNTLVCHVYMAGAAVGGSSENNNNNNDCSDTVVVTSSTPTPTPSNTVSPTPSASATPTPSSTPSPTPTPSDTVSPTPSASPTAHLTVVKDTNGGDGEFSFNGVGDGFTIATSEGVGSTEFDLSADAESGTPYAITENVPESWSLSNVGCVYDNKSTGNSVSNGEQVVLYPGDDVTCTFTNTLVAETVSPTPTPENTGTPTPSPVAGSRRHPENENTGGGSVAPTPTPEVTVTPTPSPEVTETPVVTPEVLGAAIEVGDPANLAKYHLKAGQLIGAIDFGDPDVYILSNNGYKRLFLNPPIFRFYGSTLGSWRKVKHVTPEVRDAFPTSGLLRNCGTQDPKVYGMEVTGEDVGMLHHIAATADSALQNDPHFFEKVFCVDAHEFSWFPISSLSYSAFQGSLLYHR